jgi:hypothetical protein
MRVFSEAVRPKVNSWLANGGHGGPPHWEKRGTLEWGGPVPASEGLLIGATLL